MTSRPLILDVDGTVLRNDLTMEMSLEAVKSNPVKAVGELLTGLTNKPLMKQKMVPRIRDRFTYAHMPLEPKIVALAHEAKADGREVYLCSGSEQSLVDRLAETVDFLDGAFGTSPETNLTSENKAAFLRERFPNGFDYAGNSTQDFKVWEAAHTGYGIRPPKEAERTRTAAGELVHILEERRPHIWPLLRTLRPVLWPSALAVFLPWLGKRIFMDGATAITSLFPVLLACIGLIAALSVADDLADIQRDRLRHDMKDRPLAAGKLSVPAAGIALAIALLFMLVIGLTALPGWATLTLFGTFSLALVAQRHKGAMATILNAAIVGGAFLALGWGLS